MQLLSFQRKTGRMHSPNSPVLTADYTFVCVMRSVLKYWRRPTTGRTSRYYTQANVWDVMNHHREDLRDTYPSRLNTGGGVYYDYHGRAHRKVSSRLLVDYLTAFG